MGLKSELQGTQHLLSESVGVVQVTISPSKISGPRVGALTLLLSVFPDPLRPLLYDPFLSSRIL